MPEGEVSVEASNHNQKTIAPLNRKPFDIDFDPDREDPSQKSGLNGASNMNGPSSRNGDGYTPPKNGVGESITKEPSGIGGIKAFNVFPSGKEYAGTGHTREDAPLIWLLNTRPEMMAEEANIISRAGVPGNILITTNMAGRGTDVQLGGDAGGICKR